MHACLGCLRVRR